MMLVALVKEPFRHQKKPQKVVKLPEGRCEVVSSLKKEIGGHDEGFFNILPFFLKGTNSRGKRQELFSLCCPSHASPELV